MSHRLTLGRESRKGQAMVEAALVLLVLLVMLIGIIDFAQFFFFHQSLTARVQAGTRYAIVHSYDSNQIKNFLLYNSPTAPDGRPAGLLGLTSSQITVNRLDAGDPVNDRIEIIVQNYPMTIFSPLIARSYQHRPFRVVRSAEGMGAVN
jgi:hypothetical protein